MNLVSTYEQLVLSAKSHTGVDLRYQRMRKREVVLVKSAVMNVLVRHYGATLTDTAKLFNNHHATVIYHLNNHDHMVEYEPVYSDIYHTIARTSISSFDDMDVEYYINLIKESLAI